MLYKILIVSLPGSPKREIMAQRLSAQGLFWKWVDGVRIASMEYIPWEERNDLEAYGIPRLKQAPEYVCRAIGCKRAMRRAIDQTATCAKDWVLILQDDAVLADSFESKLKELLNRVPHEAGCVLLHYIGSGVKEMDGWMRVTGDVRSMTAFMLRPSFPCPCQKPSCRGEEKRTASGSTWPGRERLFSPPPNPFLFHAVRREATSLEVSRNCVHFGSKAYHSQK